MSATDLLAVPDHRHAPLAELLRALDAASRIVLTTHVNADGDGAGSEAALAAWLARRGKHVAIVNPTPFPDMFRYLLESPSHVVELADPAADATLSGAQLVLVLDTGVPKRIGRLAKHLEARATAVLDHHPPSPDAIDGPGLRDPDACATGELVYDLVRVAGDAAFPTAVREGIYAAIVTDTGSFRFSNTTPRAHAICADLLRRGVDPEQAYRHLYARVPLRRIQVLRIALDNLEVDPELPISWITIPREVATELDAGAEDLDGVTEHARSIEGTEVALLFRVMADGATKVSFRSNGDVDVNQIARRFGGGGHVKAAGALIGEPLHRAQPKVLDAVREAVRALEGGPRSG